MRQHRGFVAAPAPPSSKRIGLDQAPRDSQQAAQVIRPVRRMVEDTDPQPDIPRRARRNPRSHPTLPASCRWTATLSTVVHSRCGADPRPVASNIVRLRRWRYRRHRHRPAASAIPRCVPVPRSLVAQASCLLNRSADTSSSIIAGSSKRGYIAPIPDEAKPRRPFGRTEPNSGP